MEQYFVARGCSAGAIMIRDLECWSAAAIVLQLHAAAACVCAALTNPWLAAALEALMADPGLSDSELATLAKTTENQIARTPDVFLLRKIWKHHKAATA
jgi:hypothetical protein